MSSLPGDTSSPPAASIVIPAHNEAAVLGRLLSSLPRKIGDRDVQVIVACNGCTDHTADIARKYGATVVEVRTPSKVAALNAGDEAALAFPRLYIDADVVLPTQTVVDLIQSLAQPGVLCAAPPFRVALEGRPWAVKAYYAIWRRVMGFKEGYVGSGLYAVSEEGRARFGRFPNVIADDLFVCTTFPRAERRVVPTEPFVIQAPWTLRALVHRRIRIRLGNLQLLTHPSYRTLPGGSEPSVPWWRIVLTNPALLPAAAVYSAVSAIAHFAARQRFRSNGPVDWARDNTTRSAST